MSEFWPLACPQAFESTNRSSGGPFKARPMTGIYSRQMDSISRCPHSFFPSRTSLLRSCLPCESMIRLELLDAGAFPGEARGTEAPWEMSSASACGSAWNLEVGTVNETPNTRIGFVGYECPLFTSNYWSISLRRGGQKSDASRISGQIMHKTALSGTRRQALPVEMGK